MGRGRKETNYWYYKNMSESQRHYAKWKKPVSKDQTLSHFTYMIFWASLVAQMVKKPPAMQEIRVQSLSCGKIPWRREWLCIPVVLPGEFQNSTAWKEFHSFQQRSLAGYSPWRRKESDMTEQLNTHIWHSGKR